VIHNKAITKTQKVHFFTPMVLNHIASLYRWNGIVDVSTKDVQDIKDPKEAGKQIIRELVHNLLMDLCCSMKHGINFYDPSLGTAARAGNLVLLRFLVGLKTATEDELVGALVVNVLKVCPDLLGRYFKEIQYSFTPRVKSTWLDNIRLLRKIYEAQPPVSVAFKTAEFVPLPRLINMVMITTVAPVCNKTMFTQGLNVSSEGYRVNSHTCIPTMRTMSTACTATPYPHRSLSRTKILAHKRAQKSGPGSVPHPLAHQSLSVGGDEDVHQLQGRLISSMLRLVRLRGMLGDSRPRSFPAAAVASCGCRLLI
ncbi:unnamed protein product, partial [Ranitomeya imitator]